MAELNLKSSLNKLARGVRLEDGELEEFFAAMLDDAASAAQIGAFLLGLERLGLSRTELMAGAKIMRENMVKVPLPFDTIDVCGTGGDGAHSLNISTASSFVLAGCGLKIAKHGNRSMSSICGAADVLEALGVKLTHNIATYQKSMEDANIAFLFAPHHHQKLAYVGPIRREMGFGTIFNMLGPMANPTLANKQLLGIYRPDMTEDVALALKDLGSVAAWVIHGEGGLDEVVLHGQTTVSALKDGEVKTFTITPEDAGLNRAPLFSLRGGDAQFNASALLALLKGEKTPYRDAVVLNSAAALVMAGNADDLKTAAAIAEAAIDTECALGALNSLIEINKNG